MNRILWIVVLILLACTSGTEPAPNASSWAVGEWIAVRANGEPLPHRDSPTFPYTETDSMQLILAADGASGTFLEFASRYETPALPVFRTGCIGPIKYHAVESSVRTSEILGAYYNCNPTTYQQTFVRRGDSLELDRSLTTYMFVRRHR